MVIPGLSDEFSDNFSDDFGPRSRVFLGYTARFLGILVIELTGSAGCSGITYMGTFSQMSSLKISPSRKKCMYFWRNYMYFRWSCSLTKRYECFRMYTGRISPVHNRECG